MSRETSDAFPKAISGVSGGSTRAARLRLMPPASLARRTVAVGGPGGYPLGYPPRAERRIPACERYAGVQAEAAEIRGVTRKATTRLVGNRRFTTLSIGGKLLKLRISNPSPGPFAENEAVQTEKGALAK